jgi:TRAP-type mannitol/chloroaromatic compound transport system permease large subunit
VLILSIIVLLMTLLMLGMPIAFALGVSGAIGIYLATGFNGMLSQTSATAYRAVAESTLAAIPLFVFMAELMSQGGMARQVFNAANKWIGWMPGGVGIASVLASAGFAAVSGSSTAASGTLAAISLPEFRRLGYGLSAATGIVAAAGTLAVMIPPSIAMIIYGIMTDVDRTPPHCRIIPAYSRRRCTSSGSTSGRACSRSAAGRRARAVAERWAALRSAVSCSSSYRCS